MLLTNLHTSARLATRKGPGRDSFDQPPYSKEVANWLCGEFSEKVDVTLLAVDFYLLLYLRDVVVPRTKGAEGFDPYTLKRAHITLDPTCISWATQLHETFNVKIPRIDSFMFTYLIAATAGELRWASTYAVGFKGTSTNANALRTWGITNNLPGRAATQKTMLKKLDPTRVVAYLSLAKDIFCNCSWSSQFGGGKWGAIAAAGLARATGTLDSVSFIDLVFDLKHNGGPMFDKNKLLNTLGLVGTHGFLNAKFELDHDTSWTGWLSRASPEIVDLVADAKNLQIWSSAEVKVSSPTKGPLMIDFPFNTGCPKGIHSK